MQNTRKTKKQLIEELEQLSKRIEVLESKEEHSRLLALEKALETIDLGITITDINGKITYTNLAEAKLHGYTVDELIGKNASMLGPLEIWQPSYPATNRIDLIRNMENWRRETINTRKDGTLFPVQLISNAIKDSKGNPIGVVTVCDDITDRKNVEARLVEQEKHYRSIVEGADAILFALTKEKIISYVSPKWKTYLGYEAYEVEQRHFCDFIHPEDIDMTMNFLDQLEEFGATTNNTIECRIKNKENKWKWWALNASCERGTKGEIMTFICIGHDISEKIWAEEELKKALAETLMESEKQREIAAETSRLKTELLGIAAHDLKNPLATISGLANFISSQLDGASPVAESAKIIEQASKKMLDLINDLLATSAIDSGKLVLKKSDFDLAALVRSSVDKYKKFADDKSQKIHSSLPSECPIYADYGKIEEIIDNLISNAIKYSPKGKSIWVNLKKDKNSVRFEVKDEGPGLTEKDKKLLFKRFQRLSAAPTGNESSTGLGLSIVKELVNLHNGEVNVESEYGKGATFFVIIPLKV